MPVTVNGEPIPDELIDAEFGQIKAHYERMGNMSCCERDDEFLGYARENLIAKTLLGQHARATMPAPTDAEIDAAIEKAKEEHGGAENFCFNLGIAPGQEDSLRPQVADSLKIDKLVLAVTEAAEPPAEEELRAFHQAHIDQFTSEEEVRASHIFKSVERVEEREKIIRELREVRRKALAGEDFHELARQHSDKGEDEIDLGFFKRGELMDEFEILTFSMEVGEISPTLSTAWGLHIARVTDRRPSKPLPFEECHDQVVEMFLQERRQELLQAKVDELRKTAVIEE